MGWNELMIWHCSPTLANIKSASLFRIKVDNKEAYQTWESSMQKELAPRGVTMLALKSCSGGVLLYVYRKKKLEKELEKPEVRQFLKKNGYPDGTVEEMIGHLRSRMSDTCEFPHEIGLFLGYPIEDVEGFVKNKGQNCIFTGYWKVYGNPEQCRNTFARYDRCSEIYKRLFANGRSLRQLTVNI